MRNEADKYYNTPPSAPCTPPDFLLEDILAEYRSKPIWEQESASEDDELPPAPEEDDTGQSAPADAPSPEEEFLSDYADELVPPEAFDTWELEEQVEGYEESDAGYTAAPRPSREVSDSDWESSGKVPEGRVRVHRGKVRHKGGRLRDLGSGLTALLTVATLRREQRNAGETAASAIAEEELDSSRAVRFYGAQAASLERRVRLALIVTAIPVWIAMSNYLSLPLPGRLGDDLAAGALVSAVALLTVMLIGLDVVTAGLTSLFCLRPGAETLVTLSALAALADAGYLVTADHSLQLLPPCAVPSVGICCALLGALWSCRACRSSFETLDKSASLFCVSSERLFGRKDTFLIRSRQEIRRFILRSEEPSLCESVSAVMAPFLIAAALILSWLVSQSGAETGSFPHTLAVLLSLCGSWCSLCAFPLLFSREAAYFRQSGAAIAGWSGVRDVGEASHLILTDADLFPEGCVSLKSVRILEGVFTDKVISFTGSLLSAAGTDLAVLFSELMRRSGATMHTIENFSVGEGGVSAFISGEQVLVGSAGFMHLCGVKVPPRMLGGTAIYTAISGSLVGVFNLEYTASPAVQYSLETLQRSRRKPIFAVRDFCVDPLLIRDVFHCSTDGFEFPSVPQRYRISDTPALGGRPAAAVLSLGGLGRLAELSARGRFLYRSGILFTLLGAVSSAAGLIGSFLMASGGLWDRLSPGRLLLYMLLWLAPAALGALKTGH